MPDITAGHTVFYTLVRTEDDRSRVRLLIDSLRAFGGSLASSPVWVFEADPSRAPCKNLEAEDVRIFPLLLPDTVRQYYFAAKVYAAARAEEMAFAGCYGATARDAAAKGFVTVVVSDAHADPRAGKAIL